MEFVTIPFDYDELPDVGRTAGIAHDKLAVFMMGCR